MAKCGGDQACNPGPSDAGGAEGEEQKGRQSKEMVECATCRQKGRFAADRFFTNKDKRDALLQRFPELRQKTLRHGHDSEKPDKLLGVAALVSAGEDMRQATAASVEAVIFSRRAVVGRVLNTQQGGSSQDEAVTVVWGSESVSEEEEEVLLDSDDGPG
ncbi:hypothetical protein CYMTET_34731 [Cymbomonas tetramitiformis]|uniref:Uncharacterized protein n=1 Tax=Cymbomonas tetramitiformis TaxID=36881 RepID=A0AAE0FAN0_9CHLO|nr:hypothetical protein CYMTET_34731 [Cymbomonas tetramitiformis]